MTCILFIAAGLIFMVRSSNVAVSSVADACLIALTC